MTANMPPWSYSGLTSFETCPKRYYHIKVAKDIKDSAGEAALWGQVVHKHLENRVRSGVPLPITVAGYEGLAAKIANLPGEKLVEQQLAVTAGLAPTTWEDPNAWCRGIIDVGVITYGGRQALLLDWKTGKRKPDNDQLMLFAGLAFSHYSALNAVQTGFVWLKDKKVDKQAFTREDVPRIWQHFLPRVERMKLAYTKANFPPKPSGLCKKYCPVSRHQCEFSGGL